MLEIFFVYFLCRLMGNYLRGKGVKPLWTQVLLVASWIVGEFAGGFAGAIFHVARNGVDAPMGMEVYLFAIFGAALGAGFAFLVAALLPSQNAQVVAPGIEDFDPENRNRLRDPNNPYAP